MSRRQPSTHSINIWPKRARTTSRNASPTSPGPNIPDILVSADSDSPQVPIPTDTASNLSVPPDVGHQRSASASQSGKSKGVRSGFKTLFGVLESSTDVFGPLKSAISGLNRCIDMFERASKSRKDHAKLLQELDDLSADLAEHLVRPNSLVVTNSVQRISLDIKTEIKNTEEKLAQSTGRRLVDAMEGSDEIMACYRRIHGHLKRLTLNVTMSTLNTINEQAMESRLARMSPAMSATYNSAESDDIRRGRCTPGTREPQINLLLEWARNPSGGSTYWMNGMAGTGKTTIAYSLCSRLEENFELGASFFCSRVLPECRQVKHIIPTIAYQLARFSVPFRCALDKILEANPDTHTRALRIQYQKLIVDPIQESQVSLPTGFIVVIDAMDECENESSLGQILDLILSSEFTLPIRFLISSRPEIGIYRRMMGRMDKQGSGRLVLHDLDADSVRSDVEAYMRHELKHVPLTDAQWVKIVERCGVLFIYASTTCRYIEQCYIMDTLDEAVSELIGSALPANEHGDGSAIDSLYSAILAAAFNKSGMSQENKTRMKNVLETVICAMEPMSLNTLADLLDLKSTKQADALLQPLRSVLNVTESTGLVTTLHASFPEFMFSVDRSQLFCCTQAARHSALAKACLQMLERVEPKFNICGLPSSCLFDKEVWDLDDRVSKAISPSLVYACRYWTTHLYLSGYRDELADLVRNFFTARLLLWMEILNLTQNMHYGTNIMQEVEKWCNVSGDGYAVVLSLTLTPTQENVVSSNVTRLAHDAWQFVSVYANHPISQSTPHIYVSMLPFWPRSRPISDAYIPRTIGLLHPTGTAVARRQLALLATWGSGEPFISAGLSADGTQLIAATMDSIDIFDTSAGRSEVTLNEGFVGRIISIAVSPDGMRIAFGTRDHNIYLWDISKVGSDPELLADNLDAESTINFSPDGSCIAYGARGDNVCVYAPRAREPVLSLLEGHDDVVRSVSFSPNSSHIASGSKDRSIRIWNVKNEYTAEKTFKGHTDEVLSVSYSPDGSRLVSGSKDGTIRVWDLQTGQTILGPLEHLDPIYSIAFSLDGGLITSGSEKAVIRVYNAQNGQIILGPLEGHTSPVCSVIFSPDNTSLFSCSWDGTIRKWNVRDPDASDGRIPALPRPINAVRYSHDGSRVISGSEDGTVHIWDVQTGEMVLGPLRGHRDEISDVDFSPDGAFVASASKDSTLRIWEARDGRDLHGPILGHHHSVNCVRFSPDNLLIASGSWDKTVILWDVKKLQSKRLRGHSDAVYSVAFSPDGSQIASGSRDSTIRVWDIKTGNTTITLGQPQGHRNSVCSVEFSLDGLRIPSGSGVARIRIWEAQTARELLVRDLTSSELRTPIICAAFSPNSLLVVVSSILGGITILDAQSGDLILGPLERHIYFVPSVQFSPNGSHIVSCSIDRTIRFWDVSNCRPISPVDGRHINADKEDHLGPSIGNTPGLWSLDADGWVYDPQEVPLVWVPSDLRAHILLHPNDSIISDRGSFKLNFDEANIGEAWGSCYQP